MKFVLIDNQKYSLNSFAANFGFAYTTVRRYYFKGYRNEDLLNVLSNNPKLLHKPVKFKGKAFKNKMQAANYFNIPLATFYRYAKEDKLYLLEEEY